MEKYLNITHEDIEKIEDKIIRLLWETMQIKALSFERAGQFLGCSGNQIRRWIKGAHKPTAPYRKMIEEGIKKIDREIPGDTQEGLVSWRAAVVPEEERIYGEQFQIFFDAICKKVGKIERQYILFNDDYLAGFQEILYLARKHKIELPDLKHRK